MVRCDPEPKVTLQHQMVLFHIPFYRYITKKARCGLHHVLVGAALSVASAYNSARAADIPSYIAEATIRRTVLIGNAIDTNYTSEATVRLSYSNQWWQIEIKYSNPEPGMPADENCMKIPDGIRTFTLFEKNTGKGLSAADVCPIAYPPPGRTLLFATWISLCARPALPLLDEKRIRRFVNAPGCDVGLFNHPRNEGYFIASYLETQNLFLRELAITNNGVGIDLKWNGEPDIKSFPAPFDKGFLEFTYGVNEETNINGFTFPRTAHCSYWGPKPNENNPSAVHAVQTVELALKRVTFSDDGIPASIETPKKLFALDARPTNLPHRTTVDYIVTNDQWKPTSDPRITYLADMVRKASTKPAARSRVGVLSLLIIMVVAPVLVVLYRKVRLTRKE
jgi:hypothetical protein